MEEKKNILFIINPVSGTGKQKVVEKLIQSHVDTRLFDFSVAYTKAPKHATELARNAALNGIDIVVAVGGDGSVNEVANGLLHTSTAMGIIPVGSGNGLARHLGIPVQPLKAMQAIQHAEIIKIDSIQLNDEYFVNIAGIGFDAHIGWEFSNYGKRGLSSYLQVILRELKALKTQKFELYVDDKTLIKEAYLISFANGSQWGNNAYIAPLADVSDGVMEVIVLKKFSFIQAIRLSYQLFSKRIHKTKRVEVIRTKEIRIKQKSNIAHIDGEPVEVGTTLHLRVHPLSLNVLVPKK